MKAFVAVTDNDWFDFLSRQPDIDEVNFWTPSGNVTFRALSLGQPLLFKLHHPQHYIVGGGFFAHFTKVPVSLAWEAFGTKNGAASFSQMRERIEKYRKIQPRPHEDYEIGCIILADPFFLDRRYWVPAPADFSKNIVRGKGYDLSTGIGRELWEAVIGARGASEHRAADPSQWSDGVYGAETLVRQRLGQGAFRTMVIDAYGRRCAVSETKTLPALQAAHIRPVSAGGGHRLDNGLLLRSDIHALYDRGYVTVGSDLTFHASPRLKEDFDNGEEYRRLQGRKIIVPASDLERPSPEMLEWHADTVFLR